MGPATPASRSTARSSGRTGAPPRAATSCAHAGPRAALPRAHRARARPVLLGHEDRVAACKRGRRATPSAALRHDRLVARLQADRRARDRLLERLAHAAVRHPQAAAGTPSCASCSACRASRCRSRSRARTSTARPTRVRRQRAGGRDRRRPAGGALRAGLPLARARQEHLRHRQLRARERRARARRPPQEGLLTTVAWGVGERVDYALEAAIFVTGAAVQWLRDGLGIIDDGRRDRGARRARSTSTTASTSSRRSPGSARRTGTRTRAARSSGLTRGTGRAHLARAALEAIAYQTVDAVRAMEARLGRAARGAEGRRRRGGERAG